MSVYFDGDLRKDLKKTHLLLFDNVKQRGDQELGKLRKFWEVAGIEEIIGPGGCFIHRCKKASVYFIVDEKNPEIKDIINNRYVLAAAIPVDVFLENDVVSYHRLLKLIEKCVRMSIPIFVISQPGCHIYYIWIDEDSNLHFECPQTRTSNAGFKGKGFNCEKKEKTSDGFCSAYNRPDFVSRLGEFLSEISEITKQYCFPVFELSSFVDYCISEHHYLDRVTNNNEAEFYKTNLITMFKLLAKKEINILSPEEQLVLSKFFAGKEK